LDDKILQSPVGHQGKTLEVRYWNVHGSVSSVRNHLQIINAYGVKVEDLFLSSLASARMVTDYRERLSGVLVLDIGRGTTDYALYKDGSVVITGVIPVGGDHLTNDLAMGLRISVKQAESLKVNSGTADVKSCAREKQVMLVGDMSIGDRLIPQRSIALILEARVDELFQIVREQLDGYLSPGEFPAGVVLTGGTSRLHGIDSVAEHVLGLHCRLGRNPDQVRPELRSPEYSTVLGLLHFGLDNMKGEFGRPRQSTKKGFFSALVEMFRP
jgi:cell division protein FtsA